MTIRELKKDAKVKLTGYYGKLFLINLLYFVLVYALSYITRILGNNILSITFQILFIIFSYPLSYGITASTIKVIRNENVSLSEFINIGLKNTKSVWKVIGNTLLKLILPIILWIISYTFLIFILAYSIISSASHAVLQSSITEINLNLLSFIASILAIASLIYLCYKSISYSLTLFILYDNQNSTSKEIVENSATLMNGNKMKYFLLCLSFIGWYLLIGLITFIGIIFFKNFSIFILSIGSLLLTPYISSTLVCFYDDLCEAKKQVSDSSISE